MYYYSTVNNIVMTHSGIITGELCDTVSIHFERPNEKGFDFLDMDLPGYFVKISFGFSEYEILTLKRYAKNNAAIVWDFAREGGGTNA